MIARNIIPVGWSKPALVAAGALLLGSSAQAAADGGWELRRGMAQTVEASAHELDALATAIPDANAWRQRAATLRAGILRATGIDLDAPRGEQALRLSAPRPHRGYTTRNFALETLPGFFCTGTLYEPAPGAGPRPAVLLAHGHFPGETGGRYHADNQTLAAGLARSGALVVSFDMVGWGDARQYEHRRPLTQALQIWNSIRLVDYLLTRADVDGARIAATGASGGGTQTFLVTAVDERVAVSAPVVQVSPYFFGGCECESGLPIHAQPGYRTNNVEIAALAAPRPQLIVTDGQDWTQHTPELGVPFLRRIYGLLGAGERLEAVHLPDEGHDFGPSKRGPVVDFLTRRLGLAPVADLAVELESPAEMGPWPPGAAPAPSAAVEAEINRVFARAVLLPLTPAPSFHQPSTPKQP